MARDNIATPQDSVISIIGPGMTIVGDCETDGTIRIEGSVQGSVKAGKAVVIGKQGVVTGDIMTQDAVISGRVDGTLVAASRLELQATCHIEGQVHTRRMQLEEGAVLNGTVNMGAEPPKSLGGRTASASAAKPAGNGAGSGEASRTPTGAVPAR